MEEDVDAYQKTEILRQSINDVQRESKVQKVARQSPAKLYTNVKSKVAGNLRSQRKSKAQLKGGSYLLDNDPTVGSSPTNPYAAPSSMRKSQAARSSGKYDGTYSAAGKSGRSSASVPVS